MSRRRLLVASGAGAFALAGCLGDGDDEDEEDAGSGVLPDTPAVEEPPDAVYVPSHREAMAHVPTVHAGEIAITPMVSYPHRFWTVTGSNVEEVTPDDQRGVHLMITPWDPETEQVLPMDAGASITITREGDVVETVSPWPMLSQTMGFHFGDNVVLPEDGEYDVEIDLPGIATRTSGAFAGRFEEGGSASFSFTYDANLRNALVENVEYLDEDLWGQRGALEPGDSTGVDIDASTGGENGGDDMNGGHGDGMMMPYSALPAVEEYPGATLGEPSMHDATILVQHLDEFEHGEDGYLLVSPRTPYNRVPMADMALSVSGAVEGTLTQTLDDALGLHYGIDADLAPGDELTILVDSPPQVSRHNGYETAFLDMDETTVTVPE